ncbi:MAG: ABC transporter ATP-binding protein [Rhodospirillaceae bacterium]
MAYIKAEDIVVDFPIYDQNRSLRHAVLINPMKSVFSGQAKMVGGTITKQGGNRVVIKALDDINFELVNGDRLGIIGHNGAGKSTMLKMLAGIYEPTGGHLTVEGSLTPVFDLMEGYDPNASGLAAVKTRALLMGLREQEADSLIREMAEFTELGEYLEMPIRTYSQGMLVRLAFGMATSVRPDILIMDEAIGAGDAAFMEKASERFESFMTSAGIVVVASHDDNIIRRWCNKAMLLHKGRMVHFGDVEGAFNHYHALLHGEA